MFSLRSNGLPCGATLVALAPSALAPLAPPQPPRCSPMLARCHRMQAMRNHVQPLHAMSAEPHARKSKGGRPRGDPAAVRKATIGVRVSDSEYDALRAKAAQLHMTPARWLREAALSRRLPSPPVAAINRAQYVELVRLSANLNQLTRLANEGQRVTVADGLLKRLTIEARRLRLALIGVEDEADDR